MAVSEADKAAAKKKLLAISSAARSGKPVPVKSVPAKAGPVKKADTPAGGKKDPASRFVWQPGDITITPPSAKGKADG